MSRSDATYQFLKRVFGRKMMWRVGLDYRLGKVVREGIELYDGWHFELGRFVMANRVLVRSDLCDAVGGRPFRFAGENVAVPADG